MAPKYTVNETLAAALIRDQFPVLRCESVVWLGEGCDSIAYRVDGDWVFRFPRRQEVESQLRLEFRLLPELAETSPLPVPMFTYRGSPSTMFPYCFAGYPYIPGVPASRVDPAGVPDSVLAGLGGFLYWLHGMAHDRAASVGLPKWPSGVVLEECRTEAMDDFGRIASLAPGERLDDWFAYFRDGMPAPCPDSELVLTHADFASEHILYDPDSAAVTGIIDWSDAALGDPALDLAGFVHWGGMSFLSAAAAGYARPLGDEQRDRARYYAACRGVGDVVFGLEHHRPEYIRGGLRAIHLSVPERAV